MADNFHVTIKADMKYLTAALAVALAGNKKLWGYSIDSYPFPDYEHMSMRDIPKNGLRFVLCPRQIEGASPFPVLLSPEMCADIIEQWLITVDYGTQPDHDGDNYKGFYLTTTGNYISSRVEIRPCWMMYGK
jgi:hypothetical protein